MFSLLKKNQKEKLPARQRGNSCLNCNISLQGDENFCPECGQRNNINKLTFKLFLDEFIDNLFTYDSQVWRTVVPLILKPGKVAYEFISGKRKKFVNPFRTYLTISLIFFLIYGLLAKISDYRGKPDDYKVSFVNGVNDGIKDGLKAEKRDSITKATLEKAQKNVKINLDSTLKANDVNLDSLSKNNADIDSLKNKINKQSPFAKKVSAFYDYYGNNKDHSVEQALDSLEYKNNFWNRFYYDKAKKTHDMFNGDIDEFNQSMFSNLSLAIFLFLPIFALFLKLLYLRRKYTYMEHMVFVFYTQTVFFILMLLFVLINFFTKSDSESFVFVFLILFAIYLLLAMKNFYKQGWFKTTLKYLITNFAFIIFSSLGLAILTAISFILY